MHSYDEEKSRVKHPYLSGNFAPIHRALPLTPCPHTGEIPPELHGGQYVRNGGNPVTNEDLGRDAHWFDGDGMLAGVAFLTNEKGKCSPEFVNQYILTDLYISSLTSERLKRPILPSITTLVNPLTSFARIIWVVFRTIAFVILSRLPGSEIAIKKISVANTAVVFHDGRALATCESGPPMRFTLPTLQTVGWFTGSEAEGEPQGLPGKGKEKVAPEVQDVGQGSEFGGSGLLGFMREWTTAHPRVDPNTQELLAFHSTFIPPYIHYSIVPHTQSPVLGASPPKRLLNAPIPGVSAARMMHDFGVSRDHTIIMDLPLSLDPMNSMTGKPVVQFEVNGKSRFGVFPRWTPEKIRWFETRACSIFHTANSWEGSAPDPDERERQVPTVEMLACRLTSASIVFAAGGIAAPAVSEEAEFPEEDQCRLYYYSFDMSDPRERGNRILHQFALTSIPFEFPSLRESAAMGPARYIYGCSMSGGGNFNTSLGRATKIDALVKVDVQELIKRGRANLPTSISGVLDRRTVNQVHSAAGRRRQNVRGKTTRHQEDEECDPVQVFVTPPGVYCQESRFVPRANTSPGPGSLDEDAGFLLTYTFDEAQLTPPYIGEAPPTCFSELWIIDARNMNMVVATVKLPQRVPYGLHGAWFSKEQVEGQRLVERVRELPVSLERKKREEEWRRRKLLEESIGGMGWGWTREAIERLLG